MRAADLALGRWPDLLANFGIDRSFLTGKHRPCPACGGRDRFRFDDKDGRGTFYCSHCGSGDGFALLMAVKGWNFKQAADEVTAVAGTVTARAPAATPSAASKLEACRRAWQESRAVVAEDPVAKYLRRRTGIAAIPRCIRFHPALTYKHDDGTITRHPAMLARVTDSDGNGTAIHRTYLTDDGHKADLPTVKKVLGNLPPASAVRLFEAVGTVGIAEGIETALSASVRFGVPVWAAISAGGLEKWAPPAGTARVVVFGDNDQSGVGQCAAWTLAKRLIASGIKAEVRIPEVEGSDWADTPP